MSSKGEMLRDLSLLRCIFAIIILCASIWSASADCLAQEATPAPLKMARATLWSFEGPKSSMAPHLVICMADRVDTRSYGSLRLARGEESTRFAKNTMSRPVGSVAFENRAQRRDPGLVMLSGLFAPTAGVRGVTDFYAEGTNRPQVIQRSPDQTSATVCSLLDDAPALGSFIYQYQIQYSLSKQWLAYSGSFTHEKLSSTRLSSGPTSRTTRQAAAVILIIAISRSLHAN
jgi:hypothetical protein